MSPVLKYHTGSGTYADLPGSIEEVTVSPTEPPVPTDLWIDTDDDTGYIPSSRLGSRNVIRNGDISIAQRGNGPYIGIGHGLDGWRASSTDGLGFTVTRAVQPIGPPLMQNVFTGGSDPNYQTSIGCRCEDVNTLAGRTVTISFDAVSSTTGLKLGVQSGQVFGGGGSSAVSTTAGVVTLSTTRARYSLTFDLPSISGKTLGTAHYLGLTFYYSAGSSFSASNFGGQLGVQSGTISITDVQLEEGSVATPFERLPQQQQLAWCQRYFYRVGASNLNAPITTITIAHGMAYSATVSRTLFPLPVLMRASPTVTTDSVSSYSIDTKTGIKVCTGLSVSGTACHYVNLAPAVSAGLTTYDPVDFKVSSGTPSLDFSAEL